MRKLLYFVTLRPYGNALLSPAARVWTACAALAILLMAAAESSAWAYVGYYLGNESWRWATAVGVGAVVFLLVWILDSTLLMLDVRRADYSQRQQRAVQQPLHPPLGRLRRLFRGTTIGIIARLTMVVGSLLVSSPYLTQIVFSRDVAAVLELQDNTKIDAIRREITAGYSRRIEEVSRQESQLRGELIRESAGKGPSGIRGRGATVRTMEARLTEMQRQVESLEAARRDAIAAFNNLTRAEIAHKYGVVLEGGGIQTRTAAMQQVEQQPGFLRVEWTVRAFLFGLFLAILILKIFQPRAVAIYYSEERQDMYVRYRAGQFDTLLPQKEQVASGGDMTPLRFDEWCRTDHAVHLEHVTNVTRIGKVIVTQQAEEDAFRKVEKMAREDLEPLLEDLESALRDVAALEEQLLPFRADLDSLAAEIVAHEQSIAALDKSIEYPRAVGAGNYLRVLDTREQWSVGLTDLQKQQRRVQVRVQTCKAQLSLRKAQVESIEANISLKSAVLVEANAQMNASRTRALQRVES